MKKLIISFSMIILGLSLYAQSPDKMSFQAVIRNASNTLVTSGPVGMQVSIVQGSPTGTDVYVETHNGSTNVNGLLTIQIGNGTIVSGNFGTIDWANGPYFIKTETDPSGGTNYTITATTQLLSVPYSLYAKEAGNIPANISAFTNDAGYLISEVDGSVTNELQTLSIAGDTISLTNGGSVIVPPSTDAQTLLLTGNNLNISNGNSIDLTPFMDNTDAQTLNLSSNTLSILNGNSINLAGYLDNTDAQTLNLSGNTLSITGGNSINMNAFHDTLSFIRDTDGNTKIQTEETVNENIIRFDLNGIERWVMTGNRLEPKSPNNNIFLGVNAGLNSTGSRNLGIGNNTLVTNLSASDNLAIGHNVLANTTGQLNIGLGSFALDANTTGANNVAIGVSALGANTTGSGHIAIGHFALNTVTTGIENLAIGYGALTASNANYNIALGNGSLNDNTTGDNNLAIGWNAMGANVSGYSNIVIGNYAMDAAMGNINNTVAIGLNNMGNSNGGSACVSVGAEALYFNNANENVAVGYATLQQTTTGGSNTAIGAQCMRENTTGAYNLAIGGFALAYMTGGSSNTAVGAVSFQTASNFSNSTALGYNTGITASNQVRVGNSSVTSIGGQVGWTTVSDARFKKNIEENVSGLDFIMKLRPVTYNLDANAIATFYGTPDSLRDFESESIKTSQVQTGFIAQEVEQAAIESNFNFSGVDAPKNAGDFYGLRYGDFTVPLVKAVQEQQEIIQAQQKTITELQNTNTNLLNTQYQLQKEFETIKTMLEQFMAAANKQTTVQSQ